MGSEKWLQELLEKIQERMGAEYQVTEVDKPEWSAADKTQIGIVKKGERTGILLNLEPGKVKRLKTGTGLEEAVQCLVEKYLEKRSMLGKELLIGQWFETMKERIVYALERKEGNEEALKHIPWEPYLDMAMVFYLVETPGGDTNYRVISSHDLEVWKVSKEEILQIARENTPRLGEPLLLTAEDTVGGNKEGEEASMRDMEGYLTEHSQRGVSAFVLTNQYGFYGASVILYDGLLERIARIWRDDVLVVPSSINELFLSKAYHDSLRKFARVLGGNQAVGLVLAYTKEEDSRIALTDGNTIFLNTANIITEQFLYRKGKMASHEGLVAHECGHIRYSDFDRRTIYTNGFSQGRIFPKPPEGQTPAEKRAAEELKQFIRRRDQAAVSVIAMTAAHLNNLLEDVYIEGKMCQRYPGSVRTSIQRNTAVLLGRIPTASERKTEKNNGLDMMIDLLLRYARSGETEEEKAYDRQYRSCLEACRSRIDEAVGSDDPDIRYVVANELLLKIWKYIKKAIQTARTDLGRDFLKLSPEEQEKKAREYLKENLNPSCLSGGYDGGCGRPKTIEGWDGSLDSEETSGQEGSGQEEGQAEKEKQEGQTEKEKQGSQTEKEKQEGQTELEGKESPGGKEEKAGNREKKESGKEESRSEKGQRSKVRRMRTRMAAPRFLPTSLYFGLGSWLSRARERSVMNLKER